MIKALELSKYVVSKCTAENKSISNLQLQKILYYIQYESLKQMDKVLFSDDIEAWKFGPVIPNVYYYFCNFGAMPITIKFEEYRNIINDFRMLDLIDYVVEKRRKQNPWEMIKESHADNGPWSLIFNGGNGNRKVISIEIIKECIRKMEDR